MEKKNLMTPVKMGSTRRELAEEFITNHRSGRWKSNKKNWTLLDKSNWTSTSVNPFKKLDSSGQIIEILSLVAVLDLGILKDALKMYTFTFFFTRKKNTHE